MEDFRNDLVNDDDVEVLEFIYYGLPRQIHERRSDFNTLDAAAFRTRYRLSRDVVYFLLQELDVNLEYPFDSNNCISPINQLLLCLRFYATDGHLKLLADWAGMHESTASRLVWKVTQAIAAKYHQFITWPNTPEEIRQVQQEFYNVAGFPLVVGAIDCTHCKIQSPGGEDAEVWRNRKGYFSVNTQVICDAKMRILNVVARWPGSTHDATIFNNSIIRANFERNNTPNCIIIGDSGYPNKNYLFTPLLNPNTPSQQLYNESHIRTRNVIERCFGVLKRRFPVLAYGCRLKLERFLAIIVATSILHNIALKMGDNQALPIPEGMNEHILNQLIENGQIPELAQGNDVNDVTLNRTLFINEYFNYL